MKKRIFIILTIIMLLASCSPYEAQEGDSVSAAIAISKDKQQSLLQLIKAHVKENYLKIDEKTIIYTTLNQSAIDTYKNMQTEKASFSKDALLITVSMLYFNNNSAGTLHYIIDNDEIKFAYIETPQGTLENVSTKNPYSIENPFTKYENISSKKEYTLLDNKLIKEMPIYENHTDSEAIIITAKDDTLIKYSLGVSIKKDAAYTEYSGLVPKSITFLNGYYYVLLVEEQIVLSEDETEEEIVEQKSRKITILSSDFKKINEIPLESTAISSLLSHDNSLILVRGSTLNYCSISGETLTPTSTVYLDHAMTNALIGTLNDDSEDEYLIGTNGQDLYIYDNEGHNLIWQTHLGIPTYDGNIFTGDLNGDGTKEIYIKDTMDTTIKYILSEREIKSSNDAIEKGESIYPAKVGDKNVYIKIMSQEAIMGEIYFEG